MVTNFVISDIKENLLSSAQAGTLEWFTRYGAMGSRNGFLAAATHYYLDPLGITFDGVSYDFFSALESVSHPTIRRVGFDGDMVQQMGVYEALFAIVARLPERAVPKMTDGLPYPTFAVDSSALNRLETGRTDLFELEIIAELDEILETGIVKQVNCEIIHSCTMLKSALDLGFRMILDPVYGDSNSRAFVKSADAYLERVNLQLAGINS